MFVKTDFWISYKHNIPYLQKLMSTADYDRFMQSQASSEGEALSGFNQSVYSVQSSTGRPSENYGRYKL